MCSQRDTMGPSSPLSFSVITGQTIMRVIHEDIEGCIAVVRECYLAHNEGRSINPPSFFLRFPDRPNSRIIGLPAHLADHGGDHRRQHFKHELGNVSHHPRQLPTAPLCDARAFGRFQGSSGLPVIPITLARPIPAPRQCCC